MFKIETLEKDVDWLACYYNEFYNDGKNLYEKQKVSVEDAIKLKNWSDQLMGDIFKKSLEETKDSMSEPQIKRYKSYVETYGYTVGYYLAPIDLD